MFEYYSSTVLLEFLWSFDTYICIYFVKRDSISYRHRTKYFYIQKNLNMDVYFILQVLNTKKILIIALCLSIKVIMKYIFPLLLNAYGSKHHYGTLSMSWTPYKCQRHLEPDATESSCYEIMIKVDAIIIFLPFIGYEMPW